MLTDGDVSLFFNAFEHPTRVTITQKASSDSYETVCMGTSSQAQRSPRMKLQVIASHRLFTANTPLSDTAKLSDVTQPGQTLKSIVNWGQKITWHASPDFRDDTANHQGPPPEKLTVSERNSQPESDHLEATELAEGRAATASADEERKPLSMERRTVVISKKRRLRGAPRPKILIKWRNYTFPCTYSDLLTPAMLIADIGTNPRTSLEALAKAMLTPSNNPLVTLHLNTPFRLQGIVTGDFLTLLVRHAQIHDPYHVRLPGGGHNAILPDCTAEHFFHSNLVRNCHLPQRPPPRPCKPVPRLQPTT